MDKETNQLNFDYRPAAAHEVRLLSIVVPAFNEERVLRQFHERLAAVLTRLPCKAEILYVNDGSHDGTQELVACLQEHDARVTSVELSRNFGKEIAITAGLDHALGDAVVVIDADLQDPPELIERFIEERRKGYDVVYAKRTARDGETWLKKMTASAFYAVLRRVAGIDIPPDTGDYRLMSRRAVDAVRHLREQHRFMKGIFAWIGFPQTVVDYRRQPRSAGASKFNYWKLWNLALEGITSFTTAPLRLATYVGLVIATAAALMAACSLLAGHSVGDVVASPAFLTATLLFVGGIQLVFIGVLGEYVGRIFNETKQRPLYFTQDYRPSLAAAWAHQRREAGGGEGKNSKRSRHRTGQGDNLFHLIQSTGNHGHR